MVNREFIIVPCNDVFSATEYESDLGGARGVVSRPDYLKSREFVPW